jgi:hypothetical protein
VIEFDDGLSAPDMLSSPLTQPSEPAAPAPQSFSVKTVLLAGLSINIENASKYPVKAVVHMNAEDGELLILIEDDQ